MNPVGVNYLQLTNSTPRVETPVKLMSIYCKNYPKSGIKSIAISKVALQKKRISTAMIKSVNEKIAAPFLKKSFIFVDNTNILNFTCLVMVYAFLGAGKCMLANNFL